MEFSGFYLGALFGAALFMAGLADPDKIIGALRFKDFHAVRAVLLAILVAMIGAWLMSAVHHPKTHLPLNHMLGIILGGAMLGAGVGIGGFCPATGLACAGSGRVDALISVVGMLAGGIIYLLLYNWIGAPIESVGIVNPGTLETITEIPNPAWIVVFGIAGGLTLKAIAKLR